MAQNDYHSFISRVRKTSDGCWEWQGCRNAEGYGITSMKAVTSSRLAHRVSFALHFGPPFKGMIICHRCDNPPCVNPDHLFAGKDIDNVHDMLNKGRHVTPFESMDTCKKGHPWTEKSTYIKPNGRRTCRICDNDRRQVERKKKGLTKVSNKLKTHCNNGHEFTESNTYIEKKTGGRRCRECVKQRKKKENI